MQPVESRCLPIPYFLATALMTLPVMLWLFGGFYSGVIDSVQRKNCRR